MDAETPSAETRARSPGSRARKAAAALGGVAALAVLVFLLRVPILVGAARFLSVDDAEAPADYLVVLGGGVETRPFTAAELYRRGLAPTVLLFEHARDTAAPGPGTDTLHRRILALEGVPTEAVVMVPGPVASSEDEARSLGAFLRRQPARRLILVTSPEHGRRARWVFGRTLSDLPVEIAVARSPHAFYDESNWWRSDQGTLAYLHEYLKLPIYLARTMFRRRPSSHVAPAPEATFADSLAGSQ